MTASWRRSCSSDEQPGVLLVRRACGTAQAQGLRRAWAARRPSGSIDGGGLGDGAVGADVDARRRQQLGHVGGEEQVRGGQLAEAEVDEPHLAVVVEEDVGEAEVAVGDAVPAQSASELPDRGRARRRSPPPGRLGRATGRRSPRRRGRSRSVRRRRRPAAAACDADRAGGQGDAGPRARRSGAATRTAARRRSRGAGRRGRSGTAGRRCARRRRAPSRTACVPSAATPKYGVEPRASTPACSSVCDRQTDRGEARR